METTIELTEELRDAASAVGSWLLSPASDGVADETRRAIWALVNAGDES